MFLIILFREEEKRNKFSERGWSTLVDAVKRRNSTEGMNQLELIENWTLGETW